MCKNTLHFKMTTSSNFSSWDAAMAKPNADYISLYNQLKSLSRQGGNESNAELWWRLSSAAFSLTLNLDSEVDRVATRIRTAEGKRYAERALQIKADHANGHLWLAITLGQMALLEDTFERAVDYVAPLVDHLSKCHTLGLTTNWRLLLVECNLHLMLWYGPLAYQKVVTHNASHMPPNLVRLSLANIEEKLRQALASNPQSLEVHGSLFTTLIFADKLTEAQKTGLAALAIKRAGYRSEERVVQVIEEMLLMLKVKLGGSSAK